jgi:phytanoyl-CoA hydroxylase
MASPSTSNRVSTLAGHVAKSSQKEYRYTLPNSILTDAQRQEYEDNGFIVIKGCVSEDKIDRWANRFREICEKPAIRPVSMTVMRDIALAKKLTGTDTTNMNSEQVTTKVQDFQDEPVLFEYCQDPVILKYVEAFCGPKIVASHTMVINKPTDLGMGTSRHPLHQDLLYFPFRPADRICAAWTAMEKVTRENGCLIAVPGSHKTELLEHGYPDWAAINPAYVGIMGITPDVKYVHLEMEKGDTVFFHPLLWHGSGRNLTPRFRKAICCHFGSGDCRFIDVKGTLQQELEDEVKELSKIKFKRLGVENVTDEMLASMKMADVWEMKSRVVQGDQMYLPIEEEEEDKAH